jgi:LmbE family N-acetylglucosaminyl deacetylase
MTRILAFHAHPDDCETLCAGTLAILSAAGHTVVIATATAGECGSVEHTLEATGVIRRAEAATAAASIGADYLCAGLPDLGVFNDDAARRAVTAVVRAANPEIVITASPIDYHPDHEATGLLVRDACFAASARNYRAGDSAPLGAIPHLYLMDPIGGRDREGQKIAPAFAVDISGQIATKRAMIEAHVSQTTWLLAQHGITDPVEAMAGLSRKRGAEFGVEWAEGFRQYRHEPYPRSPLLQTLLGDAVLPAPS